MADDTQDDDTTPDPPAQTEDRSEEFCRTKKVKKHLEDLYKDVIKAFDDQVGRSNDQRDWWDIWNCKIGSNQFYTGNSQIFVPIVRNAIKARQTRFSNQLFPRSERYVECTSEDGTQPFAHMALLEHYVRKARLRENVIKPLLLNGDVEGHYHVYVSWTRNERHVAWKGKKPVQVEEGVEDPDEEVEDIKEETIVHGYPLVEVISDSDIAIFPATSDSLGDALASGGGVAVIRRWKRDKIRKLIDDEEIDEDNGEKLIKEMSGKTGSPSVGQPVDHAKDQVNAAGIKNDGRGKYALIYEVWSYIDLPKGRRLCRTFLAGPGVDKFLSCRRNPYWSDKVPLHSVPLDKVQGAFKGQSKVEPIASVQYAANDAVNEGMDSAAYGLLPIIMTDPEKNPRAGSMILSLAAIWETSPKDTQFAQFPALWKDAFMLVQSCRSEINEALAVNPAQITQQTSSKKKNQAEIANEQQIDLLTTADAVTVIEEGILTPMLETFIEMDHQFREDAVSVRQYGALGVRAQMEIVEPIEFDRRFQYRWFGVEAARNAQQIQLQISALNIIKGIPPQQYQGYVIDLSPALIQLVESAFGPRLAPLIFKDTRSEFSTNPELENQLLEAGQDMPVHAFDNHQEHMKSHSKAIQETNDPSGQLRRHLLKHQMAMQEQAAAQQQQQMGPGQQGSGPRQGAQPRPPRGGQQPPGTIHRDQMRDPSAAPRR